MSDMLGVNNKISSKEKAFFTTSGYHGGMADTEGYVGPGQPDTEGHPWVTQFERHRWRAPVISGQPTKISRMYEVAPATNTSLLSTTNQPVLPAGGIPPARRHGPLVSGEQMLHAGAPPGAVNAQGASSRLVTSSTGGVGVVRGPGFGVVGREGGGVVRTEGGGTTKVITHQPATVYGEKQHMAWTSGVRQGRWTYGLFRCYEDSDICLCSTCCFACAECQLSLELGEQLVLPCLVDVMLTALLNLFVPCCCPCKPWLFAARTRVRTELGIQGDMAQDCCVSFFCGMCTLCQLKREVELARSLGRMP